MVEEFTVAALRRIRLGGTSSHFVSSTSERADSKSGIARNHLFTYHVRLLAGLISINLTEFIYGLLATKDRASRRLEGLRLRLAALFVDGAFSWLLAFVP
jgi:hypothetical protein